MARFGAAFAAEERCRGCVRRRETLFVVAKVKGEENRSLATLALVAVTSTDVCTTFN